MQLCIPKIGAPFFDALHAYGVGLLVSTLNASSVTVNDCGIAYEVSNNLGMLQHSRENLDAVVDQVLALPNIRKLAAALESNYLADCRIGNLDGLLAASFTTPGARLTSVADLRRLQQNAPERLVEGYAKANTTRKRLENLAHDIERNSRWPDSLQYEYDFRLPQLPIPFPNSGDRISVPMTIEPAFGFSSRRAISDGLVTDKSNVAVRGNHWASLGAFIGVARFLRAQRVGGNLVNLYVPIFTAVTLSPDTFLAPLSATEQPARVALVTQWLINLQTSQPIDTTRSALAYQTLQTQGAQQSISLDCGLLDNAQISKLTGDTRAKLVVHWGNLLSRKRQKPIIDLDNVIDWLIHFEPRAWIEHLRDVSLAFHTHSELRVPTYQFYQVKEADGENDK